MKRRSFVRVVSAGAAVVAAGPTLAARGSATPSARRTTRLDEGWKFVRADAAGAASPGFDDSAWEPVTLPHTARVEALVTGVGGAEGRDDAAPLDPQWQGVCWYRTRLRVEARPNDVVLLRFDGAMNVADVFLDGERVGGHLGGWLPFVVDIGPRVRPGAEHVLAVRLDNRDNAVTGPKPLAQLDYNMYGGLYRSVFLTVKDRLHITDPILADRPASGGVFVTYPRVSRESATVRVQVHVRNAREDGARCAVRVSLRGPDGALLAEATSAEVALAAGADTDVVQELELANPPLWSPATPSLLTAHCSLLSDGALTDEESPRIGIRRLAVSHEGGCEINGERVWLRGANRHQEYPYVGYALSDAAQWRDARKIKEAGFDYVRLSHYPHAPAFMDACDELGLVVMDCIPGWQYFNRDPAFVELQYRNCRDLVRRDRNHACVILWEVSLNESGMTREFVARTHAIAHEEYPGDQCFTAGWMRGYDVFIDARQHGGCRGEQPQPPQPCLVSEYGDWEYYAMNAGLEQDAWQDLSPAESNSRQLRWQGERALLQQALNFQEAHNDNRATVAFGDGLWVMYDYNRGYTLDIESSGCADIFRIPKFGYHFFRSQRGPAEPAAAGAGPMVFIASHWTARSATDVRVYSNCEEVALRVNGRLHEWKRAFRDRTSTRLPHPPFVFRLGEFRPGSLEAVGYVGGRAVARHTVRTPGAVTRLTLEPDLAGRQPDANQKDVIICHAMLRDAQGTLVPDAWENVAFGALGARIVGANPASSEAGIASVVAEVPAGAAPVSLYALAVVPGGRSPRLLSAATALRGTVARPEVQPTAQGGVLLVHGRVLATLAAGAPKYRVPPSAPPERRDPFRR